MLRVPRFAALLLAGGIALSGCSQVGLSAADAYKVGCPAIDAVAGSGSAVGKVALAGLQQLRDSGAVTGETRQWVDAAVQFLTDPAKVSGEARSLIKDGCAANGYPVRNIE